MQNTELPIAVRELELESAHGAPATPVTATLYPPTFSDAGKHWVCRYEIIGLSLEQRGHGAGEDAMQALMLALARMGTDLYCSDEAKKGRLKWFGADQLGFPCYSRDLVKAPDEHVQTYFV